MKNLRTGFAIAIVLLSLPAVAWGYAQPPAAQRSELLLDWTNPDGAKWTFKARVDRPAREIDRRRAVFMFGGGFSNDIDWTTPGRFEHAGQTMQITISGEDARDGVALAAALVADGWTVIRYSSIREGDPLRAQSLALAEAMPYPGTLELARFMWKELLKRGGFEASQVIALGHSLGATRAVHATEGRAAGYVFLAGAYLSPSRTSPQQLSREALAAAGPAAEDGVITRAEAASAGPPLPANPDTIDFDRSGDIRGWELAAARRLAGGLKPDAEKFDKAGTLAWPCDQLLAGGVPTLAIWGGRDEISLHGPLLEALAKEANLPLTTRYFEQLGHNLAPVEGGRTGPIDAEVVSALKDWLDGKYPRAVK